MQTTTTTTQTALDGMLAAATHGAHTHRTHYTKAMAFIQSHGHFAAITKDGLLAMSWAGVPLGHAAPLDDVWYEEPCLFEVDEDGMVGSRVVREWLGY